VKITFTKHAREKFKILENHGFIVKKSQVKDILQKPDNVKKSDLFVFIAQGAINEKYILRVVFKKEKDIIKVITFYPVRKERYL
jgi:hypothetical protein